jgi:cell division protein FtsW
MSAAVFLLGGEMSFLYDGTAKKDAVDHMLILCVVLLTGAGLAFLYSASYAFAERWFDTRWHFVVRQAGLAFLGFIFFAVIKNINIESVRKIIMPLVVSTAFLCALTHIPVLGLTINGAARWLRIGSWSFQPSEIVKFVLPLYLAHIFDKKKDKLDSFLNGILPPTLVTTMFFALILLQNNFSTALFIALNALIIFFLAGIRIRYFVGALAILLPVSSLLVFTREHRLRRVISFLWPEWEPLDANFQVNASVLTISSGGFWGKGLGQGTRKIASVPEIHSDFIFASYSEEGGFIGVVIFILLFAAFAWRGYKAAMKSDSAFRRLLAAGMVTMLVTQMLMNIAVVAGVIPATGVPLPFFSAGGSSLLITLVMSGIIVNISRGAHLMPPAANNEDYE